MENVLEIVNINNNIVFRDNDIYAIQNRINTVEAMLATIGQAFVVSGCVVSGTAPNNAVSAGVVLLDGKLHTLPAVPVIDLSLTRYIKFLSSTESDPRALSGGGTQNRIKTYLAQISTTPAVNPLQYIEISSFAITKSFDNVLVKTNLFVEQEILLLPYLFSGWSDGGLPFVPLTALRNYPRRTQIVGRATYNGGSNIIMQITEISLLTGRAMRIPVTLTKIATGNYQTINLSFEVDGRLLIDNTTLATLSIGDTIHLDNINY